MSPIKTAKTPRRSDKPTVQEQLFNDGSQFDFYQAVSLLEQESTEADSLPKFGVPVSTAFPASAIDSIDEETSADPSTADASTKISVNFMGLTGPSGILPRHYTEMLIQLERQIREKSKHTLSAWYDLFNNRLIGQMYRAWAKCRIDRGTPHASKRNAEPTTAEAGGFHESLLSLTGLGLPSLQNRLKVDAASQPVDRIDDAALLRHAGLLARRQRSAARIEAMLSTHFRVPVEIEQFRGQWLELEPADRTRIAQRGRLAQANRLGQDAVLGSRVWNRQSRIRIRVGPLSKVEFDRFLPDAATTGERCRFVMLCQLVRLAVGIEIDFDVQLILRREEVSSLRLEGLEAAGERGRLGWNTWMANQPLTSDGDEPIFESIEVTEL